MTLICSDNVLLDVINAEQNRERCVAPRAISLLSCLQSNR